MRASVELGGCRGGGLLRLCPSRVGLRQRPRVFLLQLREVVPQSLQDALELGGLRPARLRLFLVQLRESLGGDELLVEVRVSLGGGLPGAPKFLVGSRSRGGRARGFLLGAAQVPDRGGGLLLDALELVGRLEGIRGRRLPRGQELVGFLRELRPEPLVVLLQELLLLLHPRLGALERGLLVVGVAELRLDAAALLLSGDQLGEVLLRGFVSLGDLRVLQLETLRQLPSRRVRLVELSLTVRGWMGRRGGFAGQFVGFGRGVRAGGWVEAV